ncbi:BTAD domain-containing putative transcriptional regulator [Micromonospora sp. NPDC050397]|uniref:BTAD domain-containing putative transcriptional regulator n=1 Tax=Micromonospora sp. NPDC050397 TaxID=3364279 RepID=UPI00384C4B67
MGADLRFELLGPLRAWAGERELDLGPSKQRAVLAMLLLYAGRPVSPTQIVDAVWQDDPPMNGPNVVQKYIAGLRRVLEPERSPRSPGQLLTLTDTGYQLRVSAQDLDAELFERRVRRAADVRAQGRPGEAANELRQALGLWQGEPLVGFNGTFFDAARTRLVEGRAAALESWAEVELSLGRHKEMVTDLIQAVARFPVREQLHELLMLALYRSGRQAEALAAFREVRALLSEEYGVEPGESLQKLHRRILRSDPTLALTAESDGFAPQDRNAPAMAPVVAPAVSVVAPAVPVPVPGPVSAEVRVPAGPKAGLPPSMPVLTMPKPIAATPSWGYWVEAGVAVLLVLASFGLLTWAVMLRYAVRRRSMWFGSSAAGYVGLTSFFLWWALNLEYKENLYRIDYAGVLVLMAIWIGGALHVLATQVWLNRLRRSRSADAEMAVRRQQARQLLGQYPAARYELHIGRPDLLRYFDDGGLIDINRVMDQVLWHLPGLTSEQGRQIAVERSQRGGFTSLEDFAARSNLSRTAVRSLQEFLLFLPPDRPAPSTLAHPPR